MQMHFWMTLFGAHPLLAGLAGCAPGEPVAYPTYLYPQEPAACPTCFCPQEPLLKSKA